MPNSLLLLTIQFLYDLQYQEFNLDDYRSYLLSCEDTDGNIIYNPTDAFVYESCFFDDIINYINVNKKSTFVIGTFTNLVKLKPGSLLAEVAIKESEIYLVQKHYKSLNQIGSEEHLLQIKILHQEYIELQKLI